MYEFYINQTKKIYCILYNLENNELNIFRQHIMVIVFYYTKNREKIMNEYILGTIAK